MICYFVFILNLTPKASDAALALYLLHGKDILAHNFDTSFLYYNSNKPGLEEQPSKLQPLSKAHPPHH